MLTKADRRPRGTITWDERCQMLHLIGVAYNTGCGVITLDDGHELAATVMHMYHGDPHATTPGCLHGPWKDQIGQA